MASQIEARYGAPLPIDVLWRELEARYGSDVVAELQAIHRQATKRYSRAAELNKMRRVISHIDGGWPGIRLRKDKEARYRAALADPQAWIDGDAALASDQPP